MLRPSLPTNDSLQIEIICLRDQLKKEQEQSKFLKEEVAYLKEMVLDLKRHRFGKKSERWQSQEQLLFNEIEFESNKPDESKDPSEIVIEVKPHTKNVAKESPCRRTSPVRSLKLSFL